MINGGRKERGRMRSIHAFVEKRSVLLRRLQRQSISIVKKAHRAAPEGSQSS
jgi:hypothetical protein